MKLEQPREKSKNNIKKLEVKLERLKHEYKTMQTQKIKELSKSETEQEEELIESTYSELIKSKYKEIQETIEIIDKYKDLSANEKIKKIKTAIEYFDDIIKSEVPSKQVLAQVLDKIVLTKNKNIEFKLKMNIDELI